MNNPCQICVACAIYAPFAYLPMGSQLHLLGIKRVVVFLDTASMFYSRSFDTLEYSRCQNSNMLSYKVGEKTSLALVGYKTLCPLNNVSFLPPPACGNHCSAISEFKHLNTSYKWNHSIFGFLWLVYL